MVDLYDPFKKKHKKAKPLVPGEKPRKRKKKKNEEEFSDEDHPVHEPYTEMGPSKS